MLAHFRHTFIPPSPWCYLTRRIFVESLPRLAALGRRQKALAHLHADARTLGVLAPRWFQDVSSHQSHVQMFNSRAKIEILKIFKTQEETYGKPHQGQQRSTKVNKGQQRSRSIVSRGHVQCAMALVSRAMVPKTSTMVASVDPPRRFLWLIDRPPVLICEGSEYHHLTPKSSLKKLGKKFGRDLAKKWNGAIATNVGEVVTKSKDTSS